MSATQREDKAAYMRAYRYRTGRSRPPLERGWELLHSLEHRLERAASLVRADDPDTAQAIDALLAEIQGGT